MWHCPIHGSQINTPARLYKRFTREEEVKLKSIDKEIVYQKNHYRTYTVIFWVDATDKQEGEYQPMGGAVVPNGFMTIKYNGTFKPTPNDPREPMPGDLIELDKELWIIEGDIQRIRIKSLINFAVVYLPLRKVL